MRHCILAAIRGLLVAVITCIVFSPSTQSAAQHDTTFSGELNLFCGARINGSYTNCAYLLQSAYAYLPSNASYDTRTLIYVLHKIPLLPPFTDPILDVVFPDQASYQDPVDGISLAYAFDPLNNYLRFADHYVFTVPLGLDVPLAPVTVADEVYSIDLRAPDGTFSTLSVTQTPADCLAADAFVYAETPIAAAPYRYTMDTHSNANSFASSNANQVAVYPTLPAPLTVVPGVLNLSNPIAPVAAASEYFNQGEYVNLPIVCQYSGTGAWVDPTGGRNVLGSATAAPSSRGKCIPNTRDISTFSSVDSTRPVASTSTNPAAQVQGTVSYHPLRNPLCSLHPVIMLKTVGVDSSAPTAVMPVDVHWSDVTFEAKRTAYVPYGNSLAATMPRPQHDLLGTATLTLHAYCMQVFDPTAFVDYLNDAVPAANWMYPPKNIAGNVVVYALYAEDIPMEEYVVYASVQFFWPTLNVTETFGPFMLTNFQRVFLVGDSVFAGPEDRPLVYLQRWNSYNNYTLEYYEADVVGVPYCSCTPYIAGLPVWNASGLLPCDNAYNAPLNTPLDFTSYADQANATGLQPSCMITLDNGYLNDTYETLEGGTYMACMGHNLPLGSAGYAWRLASAGVTLPDGTPTNQQCFYFIPTGRTNNATISATLTDQSSNPPLQTMCSLTVRVNKAIPEAVIVINGTLAFRGGSPLALNGTLSVDPATGESLVYVWNITRPVSTALVNPYRDLLSCSICNNTYFRPTLAGDFTIRLQVYPFSRPMAVGSTAVIVRVLNITAPANFTEPTMCVSIISDGNNLTQVILPPYDPQSLNVTSSFAQPPQVDPLFAQTAPGGALAPSGTTPIAPAPVYPNDPGTITTYLKWIGTAVLIFIGVVLVLGIVAAILYYSGCVDRVRRARMRTQQL